MTFNIKLNELDRETISLLRDTNNNPPPIFHQQLKWNDYGIYVQGKSLVGIGLYNQKFEALPYQLFELDHLELLSIVNTDIHSIPENIGKLLSLKELYIGGNGLSEIPSSIANLINLQYLYILENDLVSLPSLVNFKNLKELSIASNRINEITNQVQSLIDEGCNIYFNNKQITK